MGLKINIRKFRGATTGVTDNLLTAESAISAEDCNFDEGDLRSFVGTSVVKVLGVSSIMTLDRHRGEFITKESVVDLVDQPLADDIYNRKYYTGEGSFRAHAIDLAYPDHYEPGPQQPYIAMTAVEKLTGTGTVEERSYSFTFVSRYGEEGPPSPITDTSLNTFKSDSEVYLSKIEAPELGHAITKLRLYRTASGAVYQSDYYWVKDYYLPVITIWESGSSNANDGDIVSYERENGTNILYECLYDSCSNDPDDSVYGFNGSGTQRWKYYSILDDVNTLSMLSTGRQCPSEEYLNAPSNLQGLTGAGNGMLAGFYGKNIVFSVPNYPHAWPAKELTTEYTIIGLGHYAGITIALTNGPPIFYAGTHPNNMAEVGSGNKYPCVSKRSIVSGNGGCFYATTHGLVRTSLNGTDLITENIFSKQEWAALNSEDLHGYLFQDKYFGFNTVAGTAFIIDFNRGDRTTLSDVAYAAYVPPEGDKFYMAVNTADGFVIQEWEGNGYSHRKYSWRSKWFDMGKKATLIAARLSIDEKYYAVILDLMTAHSAALASNQALMSNDEVFGALNDQVVNLYTLNGDGLTETTEITLSKEVTISIFINGDENNAVATRTIDHSNPFKLQGKYKSRRVQFMLEGYVPVDSIELATNIKQISL